MHEITNIFQVKKVFSAGGCLCAVKVNFRVSSISERIIEHDHNGSFLEALYGNLYDTVGVRTGG